MTKIEGNIRYRKSTSLVTDIVWEINDALTLLGKDCVLQSPSFSFRSHEWKLELQCVHTSWGRKLFYVLSRKGLAFDNDKGTVKWQAGVLRSDESEREAENGEIFLDKNCLKWINVKTWVGHGYNFLLSERQSLVPEGRLSIFLRLSVDPALEVAKPLDHSIISELNPGETKSGSFPHSDVLHGLSNSGSFEKEVLSNEVADTNSPDHNSEIISCKKKGSGMTKTEGNIRNRESTSLVTDIVWEIDDALNLFGKDCVLQSPSFSFRSHEWKLELQCVETYWGRRTFHVLSRKGSALDSYEGIVKWKAGILRPDESEYETAKGETSLNKYCPMWDIATIWVGDNCKFLMSDRKWLLLEDRLSVFLRLSVDPSFDIKEQREFAHVSLQTDFEDRSREATGKEVDTGDYSIISEVNADEANFGNCPHCHGPQGIQNSGSFTIRDVPYDVEDTFLENQNPFIEIEGFAFVSLPTNNDRTNPVRAVESNIRKNADDLGFAHMSLQTHYEEKRDTNGIKANGERGFAYVSPPTNHGRRNPMRAVGSNIRRNADDLCGAHDVVDSGNSDRGNERLSLKKKGTKKVLEDISDLWRTGDKSDVVLEVRGVPFRAHRAILCARIPMLASEIPSHSAEITNGVLLVQDCDPEVFGEFLHYVYNGTPLCLTTANSFSLYALADKYRVEDLKEMCLKCIMDTLCVNSFVNAALLALRYNEGDLLQLVTSFFTENIRLIITRMDWQIFMEDHPTWANELIIKSQGLR